MTHKTQNMKTTMTTNRHPYPTRCAVEMAAQTAAEPPGTPSGFARMFNQAHARHSAIAICRDAIHESLENKGENTSKALHCRFFAPHSGPITPCLHEKPL